MAMAIEAYGAEGAIALSNSYSLHFIKELIRQTAEIRKPQEEREKEYQQDHLNKFVERNKHRSVSVQAPDGTKRKISLSQFTVSPEQWTSSRR